MYKEIYYTIGNPLEDNEDFINSTNGYFKTIGQAKAEIERRVKFNRCRKKDYEIAKVTMIIERGIK